MLCPYCHVKLEEASTEESKRKIWMCPYCPYFEIGVLKKEGGLKHMVEIQENRGLIFKSWKAYAKFLEIEVQKLQQLLPSQEVSSAFLGAVRDAKWKKIRLDDSFVMG